MPHLSGVFAMKGQALFGLECLKTLMSRIVARDVVDADSDVPQLYHDLWEQHLRRCEGQGTDMQNARATIYHFGWVQAESRIVGFGYSAADGFVSQRISDGAWLHPNTVDIKIQHPDDFLKITKKQKRIDDELPPGERAGIGGDFHQVYLTKQGTELRKVYRCPDFDEVYRQMCSDAEQSAVPVASD